MGRGRGAETRVLLGGTRTALPTLSVRRDPGRAGQLQIAPEGPGRGLHFYPAPRAPELLVLVCQRHWVAKPGNGVS